MLGQHQLLAGMDASGDQKSGNQKFMAVVIGTEESIVAMTRRLGSDSIHMNMIRNPRERDEILSKIRFDGRTCIGLCVRLERKLVLDGTQKRAKKSPRIYKRRAVSAYHQLVWDMVRDPVEGFLRQHGCEIRRLGIQCDADCRDFARDRGWHSRPVGSAHMLADIVAWANNHRREPEGTMYMDIHDRLVKSMRRKFK